MKWPLDKKLWAKAHGVVNRLAWRIAPEHEKHETHWLWRLNNWVANHYTTWYVREYLRTKRRSD